MEYYLETPLTKEMVAPLRIGDKVYLSGDIYTSRDAAHERYRLCEAAGQKPPVDLSNITIFYAGPCPPRPGQVTNSIASTTSARMDIYVEMMYKFGMTAMIGKGDRAPYVTDLCKQYGGVYFISTGGISAINTRYISELEVVAYDDLGAESVKRLRINKMPFLVGIDSQGGVLSEREQAKYRRD